MDAAVAETVARATRERAAEDARADLQELRRQAVEAGRERSRRITKTSRIDPRSGEIRYNPAGRLLRDWYFHVYINQLRSRLGEPAVTIDAQQVEDTTANLRRLRPGSDPGSVFQAVAALRFTANDDAARVAAAIFGKLEHAGEHRAIQHAPDGRFDGDQLPIQISRHWYLRCYQDQIERSTKTQMPLAAVTNAETAQVASVLHTGMPIHLIGDDGVPLITTHGTALTEIDRQLALGGTHQASSVTDPVKHPNPFETLESRLTRAWNRMDGSARAHWLQRAGADQSQRSLVWSKLKDDVQAQIIQLYLRTDGPKQTDPPFVRRFINEPPATAARTMFAHPMPLIHTPQTAKGPDLHGKPDQLELVDNADSAALHRRGLGA
jgi:hypothetical protein